MLGLSIFWRKWELNNYGILIKFSANWVSLIKRYSYSIWIHTYLINKCDKEHIPL